MYRADVTPVVGLPQFNGWSQVASSQFADKHLVCSFSINGDHAGNVGREVTNRISSAQVMDANQLSDLVEEIVGEVKEMGADIQLACGIFSKSKVILGSYQASVLLKRGERAGVLLQSEAELQLVEGSRQSGDVVVLATAQSSQFLSEVELKFKSGFELDSVVTSIIPGVHGQQDSSLSSIAFISGGQQVEVEDEKPAAEIGFVEPDFTADLDETVEDEELSEEPVDALEEPEEELKDEGAGLIDIPPALKLRGAGKSRESEPVEAAPLEEIGVTQTKPQSRRISLEPLKKIPGLMATVWAWIKLQLGRIDWSQLGSKIRQFLSGVRVFAISLGHRIKDAYRRLTNQDIYLSQKSPRERLRKALPIIAGVIAVLALVGYLIFRSQQRVKAVNQVLDPLSTGIESAQLLAETDPIAARRDLGEIVSQLEGLEVEYQGQRRPLRLIGTQLERARELFDQISGQEEVAELDIFYDLRLVVDDFLTTQVDAAEKQAVFVDAEKNQAVSLDLENKRATQLALSEGGIVKDLELNGDSLSLLSGGVERLSVSESTGSAEIIAEGDSNRDATLLESYLTYIYVFNPEKRNVYRYSEQTDGFSDPIGWLSGAASFDYDQVSSWSIDGDVWVTTREGGLHRLASGEEIDFAVSGLDSAFSGNLLIYTGENLQSLYILEPDQNRLVILTKEGEFLKEIKSSSLGAATAVFANEELGRAFAVSGSIIYSMPI